MSGNKTLYNHAITNADNYASHDPGFYAWMQEVGGNYASRALVMSEPGDIVQLDPATQGSTRELLEQFTDIGIETATELIFDTDIRAAASPDLKDYDLSVYAFSDDVHAARPDKQRRIATDYFDSKNNFVAYVRSRGLPVPTTHIFDNPRLATLPARWQTSRGVVLPAYVKPSVSALSVGITEANKPRELRNAMREFYEQGKPFQIQEAVDVASVFLNAQFRVESGRAVYVGATQQLMNDRKAYVGTRHVGEAEFPQVRNSAVVLATMLARLGLKDCFNFDIAGPEDLRFIECNPRTSASTYPTIAAKRLNVGSKDWMTITLEIGSDGPTASDVLELPDEAAYSQTHKHGAFVLNNSLVETSKPQATVMIVAPKNEQVDLLLQVAEGWNATVPQNVLKSLESPVLGENMADSN